MDRLYFSTTVILWNNFNGKNKTNLYFPVKCEIFMSDSNKIWIFSPDFNKSVQYEVSRRSVQQETS